MTRRERLERKVEKRREWAEKRRAKSEAGYAKAAAIASYIPLGQPILVGHHSERRHRRDIARIDAGMRQSVESAKMADLHESKADGLEHALETSIFSDDSDAVEAIEARIKEREAEREGIKAWNASCRKGRPDPSLLPDSVRGHRLRASAIASGRPFDAYVLSNLSGRIKSDRDRLKRVKWQQQKQAEAEAAPGGVCIKVHAEHNWTVVTFAEKPARDILNALRAAGYGWGAGSWSGYADKLPECVKALAPLQ